MCPPRVEQGTAEPTKGQEGLGSAQWNGSEFPILDAGWGSQVLDREAGQRCTVRTQRGPQVKTHLADVVEVSVWHFLLSSQFLHLIK